jgi:hypothetical protein
MIIVIAHRAVFRASSAGFLLYSELSGSVQRILGSSHARKRKLPVAPEGATGKCECTQVFLRSARKISRKNPEQRQFSSVDTAASKLRAPSAAKCPLQIVLRISTCELNLVFPNGATALKPAFSNIDAVPCVDSLPKVRGSHHLMG